MKLKNLCVFGITAVFSLSAVISAYGASIKINNETLESETEPQIIEGRTMVPVRAIFEGVGATVDWNADTKTVTGKKGSDTVIMNVGEKAMTVNGKKIDMDGAAMIIDSRAFAPARYVAEAFGYDVSWNGEAKEVIIKDKIASPASVATTKTTTKETTTETTTQKATKTTTKASEDVTKKAEETTKASEDVTKKAEETTKASETAAKQTTVETTTETTTMSVADIINSSPVQGVGKSLYQLVKNDIKTAFKNYYVGNASGNGRFQRGTYSKLFTAWESAASTDEEKKYVAQSKIVYQNMVTTCTRIDQRKEKHIGSASVADYCTQRKDKLEDLINKYFTATNVDEATKTAGEIKKFASATLNK